MAASILSNSRCRPAFCRTADVGQHSVEQQMAASILSNSRCRPAFFRTADATSTAAHRSERSGSL
jgi:hypothetical protein